MSKTMLNAAVAMFAMTASAAALELDLPGEAQRIRASYACEGGKELDVEFINVGENSLAVMNWEGRMVVLANVLSGSGARYAGGQYELWDKGGNATLTDLMGGNTNGITCSRK